MKIKKEKTKEGWSAEIYLSCLKTKCRSTGKTELDAVEQLAKDLAQYYTEAEIECANRHKAMLKAQRALEL